MEKYEENVKKELENLTNTQRLLFGACCIDRILHFIAGFDADEKIGVKINSKYPTRGKIIDQYVLLYFIDQKRNSVFLSHLFHTKSDYVTLLQKGNKKSSTDWDNFHYFISSEILIFGSVLV